jgi:hypothetical protein
MTHRCPVANCTIASVADDTFMCARHWRMVPRPLQAAIYEDYGRVGARGENHREAIRLVDAVEAGRAAIDLPAGTKALTIWQPWASLVMFGAKPHEFRRWNFADKPHLAKLIGQRIVIHAGARRARVSEIDDILARIDEGESALDDKFAKPFLAGLRGALVAKEVGGAPLAAALGTVILGEPKTVVDLFKDTIADSDRLDHHMYGWPMLDPVMFPAPIPAAGAQGFWNWS